MDLEGITRLLESTNLPIPETRFARLGNTGLSVSLRTEVEMAKLEVADAFLENIGINPRITHPGHNEIA